MQLHTHNGKDLFKNMALCEGNEGPSLATMGPRGQVKGAGDLHLSWGDDEGMKYTHVLSNACCMPDSPFNLFRLTEFGKAVNPDNYEELTEDTSIKNLLDTKSSIGKMISTKELLRTRRIAFIW